MARSIILLTTHHTDGWYEAVGSSYNLSFFALLAMAKLYAIQTSPGKGRGVFATKAISVGTAIMKDRIAMKIQKEGPAIQEAEVLQLFNKLTKADQARFLDLHDGKRQYNKIFRIWKGNVFGGHGYTALYFEVSLINHACVPNAAFGSESDPATVVALKPIASGEEIFITYNSMFDRLSKRHRANILRLYYGFECSCSACSLPKYQQALSDYRRQLLNVMKGALNGFEPIMTTFFDLYGKMDGRQAEDPRVLRGMPQRPLAKPLSADQTNAYPLLVAGLLVAEGHSELVLADAYAGAAETLLQRMEVLDDVISLQAVKAVETWMQLALSLIGKLCGAKSQRMQNIQQTWKYMLDTDQMSAALLFLRNVPATKRKGIFGARLGDVVNGGLHMSVLSEPEYRAAVRQKRSQSLLD
ncbi:uncharacterized protein RCC_10419 [Ramularia collo-cygni]|uniref:SET domain-containing protein n=1 Tax=Ramularia collo-cygni TaxID=112498 RepID=A0A2D3VHB2_9PEZI|nr:uncharacterized protein RCC_10419 [Ramularia collo-cygni]CZT24692.1 uncharacterized protein RCC_10419 [Ramularia collo-cygni]